jgi:predicted transcriptional regulator
MLGLRLSLMTTGEAMTDESDDLQELASATHDDWVHSEETAELRDQLAQSEAGAAALRRGLEEIRDGECCDKERYGDGKCPKACALMLGGILSKLEQRLRWCAHCLAREALESTTAGADLLKRLEEAEKGADALKAVLEITKARAAEAEKRAETGTTICNENAIRGLELAAERDELRAKVERLKVHAHHISPCPLALTAYGRRVNGITDDAPCACGLAEALK